MERFLTVGLILVWFGQSFVWAKTENVYFVVSKSLGLQPPPVVDPIDRIIWRHKDSIAVEWEKGEADVTIYPKFKNRAKLNTTTGYLELKDMTTNDNGEYTVDINSVLLDDKYMATAIQEVPKPEVWVLPAGDDYQLTCEGDVTNAGPVTFWWDLKEDVKWVELGQRVTIQKNETMQRLKTFSCKMVNPVSEKKSDPKPNSWFEEPGNSALWALWAILLIVIAGLVVGLVIWKKDTIKAKCGTCFGASVAAGNNASVSDNKNEAGVPLREGS